MSVNLSYTFETRMPATALSDGLQLASPLFKILSAVREHGSIGRAANRLGLSYRYVWGYLKQQDAAFEQPLLSGEPGKAARLSAFGERLLLAEQRMLARSLPSAEMLAATLDRELLLAIQPELKPLRVCASYDLLFRALREHTRCRAKVLLDIEYLGSADSLERLNRGACVLAGVHLPLNDEYLCQRGSLIHRGIGRMLRLGDHKLIRFASRQQGLMVGRGNPFGLQGIADLRCGQVLFANRQQGSGTRVLFDELLKHHGVPAAAIPGYASEEQTHLSVAASVAAGTAHCGFGLRAAAARFGLDFVPILTEEYFVVCRTPMLASEGVQAVIEVLRGESFRTLASAVPGYSAAASGEIISLRRTLPWYK